MRKTVRVLVGVELLAAVPLLAYSLLLAGRIATGGVGRIGGDVLFTANALCVVSSVAGLVAFVLGRSDQSSNFFRFVHIVAALGVVAWALLVYLGGTYSHATMFP